MIIMMIIILIMMMMMIMTKTMILTAYADPSGDIAQQWAFPFS